MFKVEVIEIDGELGIALPDELSKRWSLKPDDMVELVALSPDTFRLALLHGSKNNNREMK